MRTFMLLWAVTFCLAACSSSGKKEKTKLKRQNYYGETMGTTFKISYLDSTGLDIEKELGQFFNAFNDAVSTYIDSSDISRFNKQDSLMLDIDAAHHFLRNYKLAKGVYKATNGWFDPTVMPLVNYWGFGYTNREQVKDIDTAKISALLSLVDFESVMFEGDSAFCKWKKPSTGLQLDFSAIAKGDAVDEVGRMLEHRGIQNYYVEIGGEIRARGNAASGTPWRTGIRSPKEKGALNDFQAAIEVSNISIATSGNYINYYEDKETGVKYAHTINPKTGFPEKNNLLSVSVFAENCGTADAFATGFMAMGFERAFELAEQLDSIEAFFIYGGKNGDILQKATKGIAPVFEPKK